MEFSGVVEHGKGLGKSVGMPTANIRVQNKKDLPPAGVYAAEITIESGPKKGAAYPAVTNVGPRPTVDNNPQVFVEAHILHFSGSLYGESVRLVLGKYLRPIQKFANLSEVKRQVAADIRKMEGA